VRRTVPLMTITAHGNRYVILVERPIYLYPPLRASNRVEEAAEVMRWSAAALIAQARTNPVRSQDLF